MNLGHMLWFKIVRLLGPFAVTFPWCNIWVSGGSSVLSPMLIVIDIYISQICHSLPLLVVFVARGSHQISTMTIYLHVHHWGWYSLWICSKELGSRNTWKKRESNKQRSSYCRKEKISWVVGEVMKCEMCHSQPVHHAALIYRIYNYTALTFWYISLWQKLKWK